jgi:transposase
MTTITTIGLDIAKTTFFVHGMDAAGRAIVKKELKRDKVVEFFKSQAPCVVGLEACASAHHWGREIAKFGHEVRLIPPAYVKEFVRRQKNDAADASAIARAALDAEMRFVPVKSVERQSLLMLHSVREGLVAQRTQAMNSLRGHFGEMGIAVPKGPKHVATLIGLVMQEDNGTLAPLMRIAMQRLVSVLTLLNDEIAALDRAILEAYRKDELARRLATIPGIGPLIASLLSATIVEPKSFAGSRDFAASLGLVSKQYSSGGKTKLGPITKMGNRELRKFLVVGAHAALSWIKRGKMKSPLAEWALKLLATKRFKLVAVALANKMARIAWVLMAKGGSYEPHHKAAATATL